MNWFTKMDTFALLVIMLAVAVGIAASIALVRFLIAWKERSRKREPIPHCDLEARLTQMSQNTLLKTHGLAARKPA